MLSMAGLDRLPRVLVTGAAGRIGRTFVAATAGRYRLRLADRAIAGLTAGAGREIVALEIGDLDACRAACAGIDVVLHLAADASPEADFRESLLRNNVAGTYNVFRAAADAGCQRVVFASSAHVVAGYPTGEPIAPVASVRPANMYGVSKCFGEATAAYFAHAEGLSSIAIRIGAYEAPWIGEEPTERTLSAFISARDMNQLLIRCIDTPDIRFAIVHGISDNRVKRLDLRETRALFGYEPLDDGFAIYGGKQPPP